MENIKGTSKSNIRYDCTIIYINVDKLKEHMVIMPQNLLISQKKLVDKE